MDVRDQTALISGQVQRIPMWVNFDLVHDKWTVGVGLKFVDEFGTSVDPLLYVGTTRPELDATTHILEIAERGAELGAKGHWYTKPQLYQEPVTCS